jgi:GntR family transcriptional regulator
VRQYYNRQLNKKVHSALGAELQPVLYARRVPQASLVDATESALRERLSPGRARPGDRLPPEKELAHTLGVSRGTLRLALERLESNGEIVRRQGSGTFVGRVALGAAFSEGLEVLESYASLARRQGKRLAVRNVQIEQARTPGYVAEALGLRRGTRAPLIHRTLSADGTAAAHMRDVVHPDVELPPPDALREAIGDGKMVLDLLIESGVPVAFARTQVRPRLVEPDSRLGEAMGATRIAAALELVEVMCLAGGRAVQYSQDVFAPGSIDLHVIRGLKLPEASPR